MLPTISRSTLWGCHLVCLSPSPSYPVTLNPQVKSSPSIEITAVWPSPAEHLYTSTSFESCLSTWDRTETWLELFQETTSSVSFTGIWTGL